MNTVINTLKKKIISNLILHRMPHMYLSFRLIYIIVGIRVILCMHAVIIIIIIIIVAQ